MNIYISHNGNYDYEKELYAPIKASDLYKTHNIFLPHEPENFDTPAKQVLPKMDLLVAEAPFPSTGQGIELGLASFMEVPVICFYKQGSTPSGSLRFVTHKIYAYKDADDLLAQLTALTR